MHYTPLMVRTKYSILQSTISINDLMEYCKKENIQYISVVETKNLYGAMDFSLNAIKNKIKPIFGLSVFLDKFEEPIIMLAKNKSGFHNIGIVSSICDKNGFISIDCLIQYSQNVIIIANPYKVFKNIEIKIQYLEKLKNIFHNNIYISIERYNKEDQYSNEDQSNLEMSEKYQIPIVAIQDIRFIEKDQWKIYQIIECIRQKRSIESMRDEYKNLYIRNAQEMLELYNDIPQAIENTNIIAKKCSYIIEKQEIEMPSIAKDVDNTLRKQALKGLEERGFKNDPIRLERIHFELDLICKMKFANYFLIVADFVNYAKNNGIEVGPGRGSAAGSIVAWALKITNIDPIRWGLLFERFLNPDRVSMPDIDIDFCKDNRGKIISYVKEKYGNENVANIITFGILHSKGALKDVGRVLGMRFSVINELSNMIPYSPLYIPTIKDCIEKKYFNLDALDESQRQLIDISEKVEGAIRNTSTHAAGIVITSKPIHEKLPVCYDSESGDMLTQYGMEYVEGLGIVKFDFLGLRTLSIISKSFDIISNNSDNDDKVKFSEDFDDQKTYDLISTGLTTGIFQLESTNMKSILQDLRPNSFSEIMAMISLYRPGPMENIPQYIKGKNTNKNIHYDSLSKSMNHAIDEILKETYGVIIYQEQVMEIAKTISGFSLAEADNLRRTIGKKKKEEMEALCQVFVDGAIKNGYSSSDANNMFLLIEKFAGYGFNKSHAASYAYLSYQTGFLKANYIKEFVCASLSMDIDNIEKLQLMFEESDKNKLNFIIKCPNINISHPEFIVHNDEIYYGINSISSIGKDISNKIVEKRNQEGKFKSLKHFIESTINLNINKGQIESLVYSGCFDEFNSNRDATYNALISIYDIYKNSNSAMLYSDIKISNDINNENKSTHYMLAKREYKAIGINIKYPIKQNAKMPIGIVIDYKNKKSQYGLQTVIKILCDKSIVELPMYNRDKQISKAEIYIFTLDDKKKSIIDFNKIPDKSIVLNLHTSYKNIYNDIKQIRNSIDCGYGAKLKINVFNSDSNESYQISPEGLFFIDEKKIPKNLNVNIES